MKCLKSDSLLIWETSTEINKIYRQIMPVISESHVIEVNLVEINDEIHEIAHYPLSFLETVRESKNRIQKMSLEQRKELAKLAFGSWENKDYLDSDRPYDLTTKINNVISF
ncbi:MAG: hypothetical protein MUP52_00935 [Candidatus Aminicenantes bacterium]|nr:hypothetical protein [Candidatus Aminicenantes bacterium]